ncbi:MAG: P-loop NTPase, partial [Gorillibacterium sp.]|nr:P-loop NTPase [Gorillibacterium sp.]
VSFTFLLTSDDGADKERYRRDLIEALLRISVESPHIRFRAITDYERTRLEQGINNEGHEDNKALTGQQAHATAKPVGREAPVTSLLSSDSQTEFIAIASGKGGVGKSTVTVNLATALARRGQRVGIIDADIYGFSIPDMMGIDERPDINGEKIIPVERFGVKVISMGFFVQDNAPIIWRGPMLGKMLQNFFAEVEWGELDYLLLDLPPGTGDVALDLHQMIPRSKEIIVTTPHATAAFVAARAGAMAQRTDHQILGVIENMSYYVNRLGEKEYVFGRGGGAKLADELHSELLAQIPLGAPDNLLGQPDYSPSVYGEGTDTGKLYLELADRIILSIGK